jgi:hypothetical protein
LVLKNLAGKNHKEGIFYTPDWVVRYLVRETLQPLIDEIETGAQVQQALRAKSLERKRDNSFALAVLQLNLVDPAMGSGHFLVRATEWLAEQIVYHPTTRLMTEQIVATGQNRRSREDILRDGRIPVPPGFSQEQAEIAYWHRRVVEACIYGVDLNPLAVELAKLSLWLTCIAADEPLNFLDHHLRVGNSLLWARPDELQHLPTASAEDRGQTPFNLGPRLTRTLRAVIAENHRIETTASTEMERVKAKESRWKAVRAQLDPFLEVANLWIAALAGLPVTDLDYRTLALLAIAPDQLTPEDRRKAQQLRATLASDLAAKQAEAANLLGEHIDFERGEIHLFRQKTRTAFVVPIYPQVRPLLERLRDRGQIKVGHQVFKVLDPKRALETACKRLGFPHFSPHISLLSPYGVMLNPQDLTDLIQQFCLGIWNDPLKSPN